MRVYVYVCEYLYAYVYVRVYICVSCMCICMYTFIYVRMYAYVYVLVYVCVVLMYTYTYGCVYMWRNHRNEWWIPAKCLEVRRKLKNLIEVVSILFGSNLLHSYATVPIHLCICECVHLRICGWVHLWMSLYVMRACVHACRRRRARVEWMCC